MALSTKQLLELIPKAVEEVGGPTILTTFTVITALLPMASVTGLMGPYMSPIPINASNGMLISLVVAFVFTPWMTKILCSASAPSPTMVSRVAMPNPASSTATSTPPSIRFSQREIADALAAVLDTEDMSFLHGDNIKYAVPIRVEYSEADVEQVLALGVRSMSGKLVPLSEIVRIQHGTRSHNIFHKDLVPVVYVIGDMAGPTESPLYGMTEIANRLDDENGPPQWYVAQPENPYEYRLKWDGEWQVTYETFRDMGIVYAVGLLLIYLLVVTQFRSYTVPLVTMDPIPLTIVGIMPGHALFEAKFTVFVLVGEYLQP